METGERKFAIHPSSIMMVLILGGITTLFGALTFAYLYTRTDRGMAGIELPWLFVFNTFILASAGLCMHRFRQFFQLRQEKQTLRWGIYSLIATLLFLGMQGLAWYKLFTAQIHPGTSGGYGYLYAISIIHFLHVAAGIPFLARLLIPLYTGVQDGSGALYFIDEHMQRKLKHTSWYWHFIDGVWIYLVIFFLINSMI